MTDVPPSRPAWPGEAPQPSTPAPEAGLGDQPAAPAPAWPGGAQTPPAPPAPDVDLPHGGGFRIDLKLVIAVLIGLVSVTGAVLTWRSAQLGEFATDKDRQVIAETVRQQQDAADDEISLQDARGRVADHAAALAAADILDQHADRFAAGGDDVTARAAADEAQEQRSIAAGYLLGSVSNVDLTAYVVVDEATGRRALDEDRLREDLRDLSQAQSQVDPSQTVREANRLRDESQRLDGWLVPLVSAIVLLTLAQVSRNRVLRPALTGVATVVWIGVAALALGGA